MDDVQDACDLGRLPSIVRDNSRGSLDPTRATELSITSVRPLHRLWPHQFSIGVVRGAAASAENVEVDPLEIYRHRGPGPSSVGQDV
jgi:hypothetical protein